MEHFPGAYGTTGPLIVAFFLTVELRRLGIGDLDRTQLHETISDLIDPSSGSLLTKEGIGAINEYAYGGFDTISEWFDERPHTFEGFFVYYKNMLDEAMQELRT